MIAKLNTQSNEYGYNINKGGNSGNAESIPICQFDLDMNYIKTYDGAVEAEKLTGIHNGGIRNACKNHNRTAGGYFWFNKEDVLLIDKFKIIENYKKAQESRGKKKRPVYQFDENTMKLINMFSSVADAARTMNVRNCCIIDSCNGRQKSSCGSVWRYVEDIDDLQKFTNTFKLHRDKEVIVPVCKCDLNLNIIKKYDSLQDAEKDNNTKGSTIKKMCNHEMESYKGITWRYLKDIEKVS